MNKLLVLLMTSMPASGAIALLAHVATLTTAGANTSVTSMINTTGASLKIVAIAAYDQSAAAVTVSDPAGNSWHPLTNQKGLSNLPQTTIWYAYDHAGLPLVTSATDAATVTCTGCYPGVSFSAWSGTPMGSDPYDSQLSGGGSASSPVTAAAISPSQNGDLLISSFSADSAGTATQGSPFTLLDYEQYVSSATMGIGAAYYVQPPPSAPQGVAWSVTALPAAVSLAAFKGAASTSTPASVVLSGVAGSGHVDE